MLELKIVDPAMGSGHFLVSLVDWLSDKVFKATEDAAAIAGENYASPLLERVATLRQDILTRAQERGWPIVAEQLDDPHIVRRMVLKRCIFGVDLNPMAVELAKVSLWLHSFTVGAPLSFLDHHLRCGNSVLGAWMRPTTLWLANRGSLMVNQHLSRIDNLARTMAEIENIPDNDISEVEQSKALFSTVEEASAPLNALLDLLQADALMGVFTDAPQRIRETADQIERVGRATVAQMPEADEAQRALKAKALEKVERALAKAAEMERRYARAEAFKMVLEGTFGDPARIATGEIKIADDELRESAHPNLQQESLLPSVRPDDRRRLTADALVREARVIADEQRFLHWEVTFPGVWREIASQERTGGFDAVIGNPPYVRQEMISGVKPALAQAFKSFAGTADLYVYFYEQGLKLLRPGGRMAYVVTNKWLKAGYAEGLRRLFAEDAWVEFMADFGHARRFFPDADVFPCVIAIRRPDGGPPPEDFELAVIPRDDVPRSGLADAVRAASYLARREQLTAEPWTLEPPDVAALLMKIRANGAPLADYAGVRPLYGIKTGLNEAFLIDTATKERLISEDRRAAEVIKPYLRGQDINRWLPEWAGLWMIFARKGINIQNYPSILRYLTTFRAQLEPKPINWKPDRPDDQWPGRKPGPYAWYEIQDPVDYHQEFLKPKLLVKMMAYNSRVALDTDGFLTNNAAVIIPTDDRWLHAVLQSPAQWYFQYRTFPHKKDETIAMDIPYLRTIAVPQLRAEDVAQVDDLVGALLQRTSAVRAADNAMADWLHHEIGHPKLPSALLEASVFDSDDFVIAVRSALPKREALSPARLLRFRDVFNETVAPARADRAAAEADERALSTIVNRAYGLTPAEVSLMWRTAPPRMPITRSFD
jgi:hypothetical protein